MQTKVQIPSQSKNNIASKILYKLDKNQDITDKECEELFDLQNNHDEKELITDWSIPLTVSINHILNHYVYKKHGNFGYDIFVKYVQQVKISIVRKIWLPYLKYYWVNQCLFCGLIGNLPNKSYRWLSFDDMFGSVHHKLMSHDWKKSENSVKMPNVHCGLCSSNDNVNGYHIPWGLKFLQKSRIGNHIDMDDRYLKLFKGHRREFEQFLDKHGYKITPISENYDKIVRK